MSSGTVNAEVIAVFERCCYLKLQERLTSTNNLTLLCVGQSSIQPGPLNCLLDDTVWVCLQQQLKTGLVVRVSQSRLTVGGTSIDLPTEFPYQSPLLSSLCKTSPQVALARLQQLTALSPAGSLSAQILCHQGSSCNPGDGDISCLDDAVLNYLLPLTTTLYQALETALSNPGDSPKAAASTFANVHQLLGAGVGLTPAGDDILAGVLLALWFFDQPLTAQCLQRELLAYASTRTNLISLALLKQSAAGSTSLPWVKLFTAIGNCGGGRDAETHRSFSASVHAGSIDAMGHSSGWDCLAGIALATQALVKSRTTPAGTSTGSRSASTTTRFTIHA